MASTGLRNVYSVVRRLLKLNVRPQLGSGPPALDDRFRFKLSLYICRNVCHGVSVYAEFRAKSTEENYEYKIIRSYSLDF